MQQFVVPQFIDVEDKIIGPITTRQFLIMLGIAILNFIVFRMFDRVIFIIVLISTGGFGAIFAFMKVNGQPFHFFILNILQTVKTPSRRYWRKDYKTQELDHLRKLGMEEKAVEVAEVKKVRKRHMKDLALIVNTGGYYEGEDIE